MYHQRVSASTNKDRPGSNFSIAKEVDVGFPAVLGLLAYPEGGGTGVASGVGCVSF